MEGSERERESVSRPSDEVRTRVVVTDVDIPFGSMVNLMVKWALASIPAAIFLGMIGGFTYMVVLIVLAALGKSR